MNTILKLKKEKIVEENFLKATELKTKQYELETKINKLLLQTNKNNVPKEITKDMVLKVISEKANVPLTEFNLDNKKILSLEEKLNSKVKGQKEAINLISNYAKRKQLGFSNNKVHSFLLVGKTGVGKTMLVKEYAKELYSLNHFIRVDMSEYKEEHAVSKIIGSPPGYVGYDDQNYLLEKVRNNPYCVLLLDEIEKASLNVIKLFLQVLDEGKINDSKGNPVYFNNVTIFMTSNLGASKNSMGFNTLYKDKLVNTLQEYFSVEFINRIDDIVVFNSLEEEVITDIIKTKLNLLKSYYSKKSVRLSFSKKLINEIKNESNYNEYGARKIDKVIDRKVNNYIINKILLGDNKILVSETS